MREGDQNTRCFHKYASTRKKRNYIQRIKDEDGEQRETPEEIQEVITGYFSRLFTTSSLNGDLSQRETVERVTNEENEALMADITAEEVKTTVFSMHPDKSPRPDGLHLAFFQVFWSVVGQDVTNFCQHFMNTGALPDGVNQTLIFQFLK